MTEVIAVFRSRSQAADCNSRLRALGVPSCLVNTPKEANVGCGLSVRISAALYPRAAAIVRNSGYSAFHGFYGIYTKYGRTIITRVK